MNKALELYEICHPMKSKINKARKKGLIQGNNYNELIDSAIKEGVVSKDQADQLIEYTKIADDIINVDDFSQEEIDQIR
jgi:ribosomal protein S20